MGMAASGNLNPTKKYASMFEPVHGSRPGHRRQGLRQPDRDVPERGDDARLPRPADGRQGDQRRRARTWSPTRRTTRATSAGRRTRRRWGTRWRPSPLLVCRDLRRQPRGHPRRDAGRRPGRRRLGGGGRRPGAASSSTGSTTRAPWPDGPTSPTPSCRPSALKSALSTNMPAGGTRARRRSTLIVPLVTGQDAAGLLLCSMPTLGVAFSYADPDPLRPLAADYVQSPLRGLTPAAAQPAAPAGRRRARRGRRPGRRGPSVPRPAAGAAAARGRRPTRSATARSAGGSPGRGSGTPRSTRWPSCSRRSR